MSLILTVAGQATSPTTLARSATTVASTATTVASTATTTATTVAAQTAKSVSATSLMFQLVIGLGVVLAIIWVAARIMRGRVGTVTAKKRTAPLAVIGRQPLGKGVQIAVVRAGTETYLLGVTAHQVTRLARFKPDEFEDAAIQAASGSGSPDDLPPAVGANAGNQLPVPFRLNSTIRQLQERTLRRR